MIYSKRNLENRKVLFAYIALFAVITTLAFLYSGQLNLIFSNPEKIKQFIGEFGVFGPIVLILLQTFQALIFIIPGPVITMAGGYSFGITLGAMYSLIGTMLGSVLVFSIAKKFGRAFVIKIINKKELEHFDAFFKKKGKIALLITRTIPILFPHDVVSFAAGLTQLSLKEFAFLSFLGFIPNVLLLTLFGEQLSHKISQFTLLVIAAIGIGTIAYLFRHHLKIFFIKEIRNFERELKIIEGEF